VRRLDGCRILFGIFVIIDCTIRVAPQHKQLAKVLHAFTAELLADFGEEGFARLAFIGLHAHLDQCMRGQREVNLVEHGGRQSVLPHHHHRIEMMRSGAKSPARAGGQGGGGGHQMLSFLL
jgi:hypothetical protein